MNVLIIGFNDNDFVTELKKANPDWNVVWMAHGTPQAPCTDCDIKFIEIQRGRIGDAPYSGACAAQYQEVFDQFHFYLRMITRVTGEGWIDWNLQDYTNLFNLQFDFFARLFERHRPGIVILSTFPHDGCECIPYLLAKALRIKMLMPLQSIYPNRFFCCTSVESYGKFDEFPAFAEPQPYRITKEHFKPHPYLVFRPEYGMDLRTVGRLWGLLLDKGPARLFMRYFRLREYRKTMRTLCRTEKQVDFNVPFVYFPLHLQPELTTSAIGGIYEDQLLAIERLSITVPKGWWVYVKENRVQTEQYRGRLFFQRLGRLPNVCFISAQISTFKLTERAQFVATITGTAGWEAITGGKNVLVFGHTWYRTLPGVFEFNESFSVEKIMSYRIDHEELERKTGEMISRMLPGIVEAPYQVLYKEFNPLENTKVVVQGLTRCVKYLVGQP